MSHPPTQPTPAPTPSGPTGPGREPDAPVIPGPDDLHRQLADLDTLAIDLRDRADARARRADRGRLAGAVQAGLLAALLWTGLLAHAAFPPAEPGAPATQTIRPATAEEAAAAQQRRALDLELARTGP
jgi:hypothetical protein